MIRTMRMTSATDGSGAPANVGARALSAKLAALS